MVSNYYGYFYFIRFICNTVLCCAICKVARDSFRFLIQTGIRDGSGDPEIGSQLLCLQLEKLPLSAEHALEMVSFC